MDKPEFPSTCTLTVPAGTSGGGQVYIIDLDHLDLGLLSVDSLLERSRSEREAAEQWESPGPMDTDFRPFTVHAVRAYSPTEDDDTEVDCDTDNSSLTDREENTQPIKVTQSEILPTEGISELIPGMSECHMCFAVFSTVFMMKHLKSTEHLKRLHMARDAQSRLRNQCDRASAKINQNETNEDHNVDKTLVEAHKEGSLKRDDKNAEFYKDDDQGGSQESLVDSVLVQQDAAKVLGVNGTVARGGGGKASDSMLGDGRNQRKQTVCVKGNSGNFGSTTNEALVSKPNHGIATNKALASKPNHGNTTHTAAGNSENRWKPERVVSSNSRNRSTVAVQAAKHTFSQNAYQQIGPGVYFCTYCKVKLPNTNNVRDHDRGKKHMRSLYLQRKLNKTNAQSPQTVPKVAVPSGQIQWRVSNLPKEDTKEDVSQLAVGTRQRQKNLDDEKPPLERCELCSSGPLLTEKHINSRGHRSAVVKHDKQNRFYEIETSLVQQKICLTTCDGMKLYLHLAQWHGLKANYSGCYYVCILCREPLTGYREPYDHLASQRHLYMIHYTRIINGIRNLQLYKTHHCIACNDEFTNLKAHLGLRSHINAMVVSGDGAYVNVVGHYTEPKVWDLRPFIKAAVCCGVAWYAVKTLGYKRGLLLCFGGAMFQRLFLSS